MKNESNNISRLKNSMLEIDRRLKELSENKKNIEIELEVAKKQLRYYTKLLNNIKREISQPALKTVIGKL